MSAIRPAGVILCGGQSARMGTPKSQLPWGSGTLLEHLLHVVGEVCDPVVLAAAATTPLPTLPPSIRIARDLEEHGGPLAGWRAAWQTLAAAAPGAALPDLVFVTGCDYPFLTAAIIRRCCERIGTAEAVVVTSSGQRHPLIGVYRGGVGAIAEEVWQGGGRSLRALLSRLCVHELHAEDLSDLDPQLRCVMNVNTPAEYAAAWELRPFAPS